MRVLALDAATEACSVALLDGTDLIGRFEEPGRGHAERLLGMVDEVLAESGLGLCALDGIAASVGPGGFTGVRITVAAAQGLAFGAGLGVVPVSTLESLAAQAVSRGASRVLACLDARMHEVYWGAFLADAPRGVLALSPPRVSGADAVRMPGDAPYRGIGRGFGAYPALGALPNLVLDPADCTRLPNAREIAVLGRLRFAAGEALDPADLTPLYLRDKVAFTAAERAERAGRS